MAPNIRFHFHIAFTYSMLVNYFMLENEKWAIVIILRISKGSFMASYNVNAKVMFIRL